MPRGSLVLTAVVCGAVAQTLILWGDSWAFLAAAAALFAGGGWLLASADGARAEPEIRWTPALPGRRGSVPLLALAVVTGVLASVYTGEEFSFWQVIAHVSSLVAIIAFGFLGEARGDATERSLSRADLAALLLIAALACALRLWRLASIPPILWEDEIYYLQDAIALLSDEWPSPYFTGAWGAPLVHAYSIAAATFLVPDRAVALRLVSVIPGMLSVPLLYLTLRELYDRRFAIAGSFLMAISAWNVLQTRHGYVWAMSFFAETVALYGLARGLRRGHLRDFVVSGLGLGLGVLYSYAAALMPAVAALFVVYLLATKPRLVWARRRGLAITVLTALLLAGPRITTYAAHPETRGYAASAWIWSGGEGVPFAAIGRQLGEIALSFNQRADTLDLFLPQANGPLLDPISAAAFGLGFFWAVFSWRRPAAILLLLTFVVLLLPSALALAVTERATAWRACGVVPGLFGLAGAPFAIAYDSAERRWKRILWACVSTCLLALATVINVHAYFVRHPTKAAWHSGPAAMHWRAAQLLLAAPRGTRVVITSDLEYPYVHALAWGRREYEAITWPEQRLLPDLASDPRRTLVIGKTLQRRDDDVSSGGVLIELLQHYYPGGRREDESGGDGLPLIATYRLERDDISAAHGLTASPGAAVLGGTLVVPSTGEYRLTGAGAAEVRVDGRRFDRGFLAAGLHDLDLLGHTAREGMLRWSHDSIDQEEVPESLLLRRTLPLWGLRESATSPARVWQRWMPILWNPDTEVAADFDGESALEWTGRFTLSTPGSYTLLVRTRARSSIWIDDAPVVLRQSAWPDWQRFGLNVALGWHELRVLSEPPVEWQDLQLFLLPAEGEPILLGGDRTRPPPGQDFSRDRADR